MKQMSKTLALLCALVVMLTALGGVALADGEAATNVIVKIDPIPKDGDKGLCCSLTGENGRFYLKLYKNGGLVLDTSARSITLGNVYGPISDGDKFEFVITDANKTWTYTHVVGQQPDPAPITPAADPIPDPAPNYAKAKITNVTKPLTVRARPDSKAEALEVQVQPGESIEIVEYTYGNAWYRIVYNDGQNAGWVPAKYLVAE